MFHTFSHKFQRQMVMVEPGEFYASSEDLIISTVLGSCVSVILFDTKNGLGGMNHFMLPGDVSTRIYETDSGRYGMNAMELLINALLKAGCNRANLKAKVFGGGSVIPVNYTPGTNVGENNIKFAFSYLNLENIPIVASDVGGKTGRKLLYFPSTAKVLLKRIIPGKTMEVARKEREYRERIAEQKKWGELELFS